MKSFTEKVKEHRGQLGLSQQELADKAGIGVRTLTYYECGKRFPQAAQLYKLAKALGVSTEYLKNDEIEDPSYGMDRMDYVEEMRRQGGRRESLDLEAMLRGAGFESVEYRREEVKMGLALHLLLARHTS